jgi:hypothetical protein
VQRQHARLLVVFHQQGVADTYDDWSRNTNGRTLFQPLIVIETDVGYLRDITPTEAVHAASTLAAHADLFGRKTVSFLDEHLAHQLTRARPVHVATFSIPEICFQLTRFRIWDGTGTAVSPR